ncbi:MAG: 50S ribosomal protein L6 [Gemmatimonadetes bacterium]|nr:50S ribosomal protein L6 [Gemmatimonadota bacterium]NNF38090.1 50S ribosomal protein L6 [Gemmatimonadota bacterium]
MSRIGKQPVSLPKGVDVSLDGQVIRVKGKNGELTLDAHPEMGLEVDDAEIRVTRPSDASRHKALHGLTRSLVANMVEGVTDGFTRTLEIVGVGYRAEMKGSTLHMALGFSHPITFESPHGVTIETPNQTTVVVKGADKQAVGQAAAVIRGFRPPEPYKGKGVRYQGEQIRRKAGKTAGA